jgi:long-chain fatty acid transport protein
MRSPIAALILAAPLLARAGGYAVPNVGPRDLAMAGSLVAAQDGAGAVFANPAALAGLAPGGYLSLAASAIDNESKWTSTTGGGSASQRFMPALPPALFAAYSGTYEGHGWGIGTGMAVPWGGNVFWPKDWPGRFHIIEVDQRTYAFFLNGGLQITPEIRLGGGLVYYRTTERLKQGTNFIGVESTAEVSDAGGEASWQIAAELTPFASVPLKLGVDYKHQAVQKLTGRAHFENPPPQLAAQTLDQGVTRFLTVPSTVLAGAALQASPRLLLTLAFSMDRFKVYEQDLFSGSAGTTIVVPRNFTNSYTFRGGVEYAAGDRWKLRAGLQRDIGATPTDRLSPTLPDASSWDGAVGVAYALRPNLALQGTFFYARFDRITTTGTEVFPGKYDIFARIASVGVTWSSAGPAAQ